MALLHNRTVQALHRVIGQATQSCEVLPSVQFDLSKNVRFQAHTHSTSRIQYKVSNATRRDKRGALIDRGANGGIIGDDAHVIHVYQDQEVDVTGIDNHEINSLKVVDACAKITTQRGPVIGIFRQYAYHGRGRTIHSSGQIEWYKGNFVKDRSMKVGGSQNIRTLEGYVIPIDIINGLPYISMTANTEKELRELPHVILTSSATWNPKVLDHVISNQSDWFDRVKDDTEEGYLRSSPFDEYGNYKKREPLGTVTETISRTIATSIPEHEDDEDIEDNAGLAIHVTEQHGRTFTFRECYNLASNCNSITVFAPDDDAFSIPEEADGSENAKIITNKPVAIKPKPIDYGYFSDHFLGVPTEKIRATFQNTTQFASGVVAGNKITQTIKSPWPANNVHRRNEPVASDTIYAASPAVDNGCTMAQLFIGRKSLVADAYGIKSTAAFVNTLEDNIRKRGAMDKLVTDSAKVEISERVRDILRSLCIKDWQSEQEYQHQNFAEHCWKLIKRNVEWLMNLRKCPANTWLLALEYACDVMNLTSEKSLGNRPPMQVLTISVLKSLMPQVNIFMSGSMHRSAIWLH